MTINLDPELEAALKEHARRQGMTPEALAQNMLREKPAPRPALPESRDEWERQLRALAIDCGVSVPIATKRMNGEWFDLDSADVAVFKRRKFM